MSRKSAGSRWVYEQVGGVSTSLTIDGTPTSASVVFRAEAGAGQVLSVRIVIGPNGQCAGVEVYRWVEHEPVEGLFGPEVPVRDREVAADGDGLTVRALRSLPLGDMQDKARDLVAAQSKEWIDSGVQMLVEWAGTLTDDFDERPRPGRAGRPDRSYAVLAQRYATLGGSNRVQQLAGETNYSPSRVAGLIHEARRRGLLTAGPPGRAGGELTEKARRLLTEEV